MEFRLTYRGPLYTSQQAAKAEQYDKRADHKHELRLAFHPQLKRLWEVTRFLRTGDRAGPNVMVPEGDAQSYHGTPISPEAIAANNQHFGWDFVPLVTEELHLFCGLDVLLMRPDYPEGVIESGDLDNRFKTLIDALRLPKANERYAGRPKLDGPMYCLLDDDKLVTKLTVQTDQLLDWQPTDDPSLVNLVILVSIRPHDWGLHNMMFG